MNEKVKLPNFVCDWLDQHKEELCDYPMVSGFSKLARKRDIVGDVRIWLFSDTANQWKLIDALRYGYEPEPEQLYYVRFTGNNGDFLNLNTETGKVFTGGHQEIYEYKAQFTMPEIIAIDPRYKAFAVKVEEVDADD